MTTGIVSIYLYGSLVYGVAGPSHDYDLIVITKEGHRPVPSDVVRIFKESLGIKDHRQIDINFYTESEFQTALEGMEISFLECVNGASANFGSTLVYGKAFPMPKIDLQILRSSISKKVSNSWVKSKKKLDEESFDFAPYVGKKSAWHSLRILMFGIQLAKYGKIVNIVEANGIFRDVMDCEKWSDIDSKFRKIYNSLSSEFKLVAPLKK